MLMFFAGLLVGVVLTVFGFYVVGGSEGISYE